MLERHGRFFYTRYNIYMVQKTKLALSFLFVFFLFAGAIYFAGIIQDNSNLQEIISSFGYVGILFVSFISGLNFFVPIPATAFIPIFSASGFALPVIIVIIVIGTTIADLISYYIGTVLKPHADKSRSKVLEFARKYCVGRKYFTELLVFLYATLVPLPNELLLLPLGTLGVKLRTLFIPFALGTTVHVTIIAYGLTAFIAL